MAAPTPAATAFQKLFTQCDSTAISKANNTTPQLNSLVNWFAHIHGEKSDGNAMGAGSRVGGTGQTFAEKWVARGKTCSDYRNGSYIGQAGTTQLNFGESADLETVAPLGIATIWGGWWKSANTSDDDGGCTLSGSMNATDDTSTISVSVPVGKPSGMPAIWPFVYGHYWNPSAVPPAFQVDTTRVLAPNPLLIGAARTTHSVETDSYVTWIRIDDEIMAHYQTPTQNAGVITLHVIRGMWGTTRTTHASGARVFVPCYVGTVPSGPDVPLSGVPARKDPYQLRYAMKIWQGTPVPSGSIGVSKTLGQAWNWIYDQTTREADDTAPGGTVARTDWWGISTMHADVSSPGQYNIGDAWGNTVYQWDDQNTQPMTTARWALAQATKFRGLRTLANGGPDTRTPKLFHLNSMDNQDLTSANIRDLANTVDGSLMEGWLQGPVTHNPGTYIQELDRSLATAADARGISLIHWARWNRNPIPGSGGNPSTVPIYKRVAYAGFLLSWRPGLPNWTFGGPWGASSNLLNQPEPLFFYDFGTPSANYADSASLPNFGGDAKCYIRAYSKGAILLNTDTVNKTYTIPAGEWYRIGNNANLDQVDVLNESDVITVNAEDAAFLVNTAGGTDLSSSLSVIDTSAVSFNPDQSGFTVRC